MHYDEAMAGGEGRRDRPEGEPATPRRLSRLTLTGGLTAAIVATSFVAVISLRPPASHAAASAMVTDLPMLTGGTDTRASGINDAGEIVGDGNSSLFPGEIHAILWTGGAPT